MNPVTESQAQLTEINKRLELLGHKEGTDLSNKILANNHYDRAFIDAINNERFLRDVGYIPNDLVERNPHTSYIVTHPNTKQVYGVDFPQTISNYHPSEITVNQDQLKGVYYTPRENTPMSRSRIANLGLAGLGGMVLGGLGSMVLTQEQSDPFVY